MSVILAEGFHPAPPSVMAEARYLLGFRTGAQSFDRQRVIHASLNVANWLNAQIPSGSDTPETALAMQADAPTLDQHLAYLAEETPEGALAITINPNLKAFALQVLQEFVMKWLSGVFSD